MNDSRGVLFAPWQFLLFITFMALKLMGHISWSWWWVTGPLWIPLTIVIVLGCGFLAVAATLKWWDERSREEA